LTRRRLVAGIIAVVVSASAPAHAKDDALAFRRPHAVVGDTVRARLETIASHQGIPPASWWAVVDPAQDYIVTLRRRAPSGETDQRVVVGGWVTIHERTTDRGLEYGDSGVTFVLPSGLAGRYVVKVCEVVCGARSLIGRGTLYVGSTPAEARMAYRVDRLRERIAILAARLLALRDPAG